MEIYLNKRVVVFCILLLVILSLLYSTTFHAPFNFDDEVVIKFEAVQKRTHDSRNLRFNYSLIVKVKRSLKRAGIEKQNNCE